MTSLLQCMGAEEGIVTTADFVTILLQSQSLGEAEATTIEKGRQIRETTIGVEKIALTLHLDLETDRGAHTKISKLPLILSRTT